MKPQDLWRLLKQTFKRWRKDDIRLLAGALAYYTVISLAPATVLLSIGARYTFGEQLASRTIADQVRNVMGPQVASAVTFLLNSVSQPGPGAAATALSLAALLFSASLVFAQLRNALNTLWGVQHRSERLWTRVKHRLLAFALLFGVGVLLFGLIFASFASPVVFRTLSSALPGWIVGPVGQILNIVVLFGALILLFAVIYRYLPDALIRWGDVWVGAAVTALLFVVGQFLIGFYLRHNQTTSLYGAAGTFFILLLWVYYSAHIFLFGAEFTQVFARQYGSAAPLRRVHAPGGKRLASR